MCSHPVSGTEGVYAILKADELAALRALEPGKPFPHSQKFMDKDLQEESSAETLWWLVKSFVLVPADGSASKGQGLEPLKYAMDLREQGWFKVRRKCKREALNLI